MHPPYPGPRPVPPPSARRPRRSAGTPAPARQVGAKPLLPGHALQGRGSYAAFDRGQVDGRPIPAYLLSIRFGRGDRTAGRKSLRYADLCGQESDPLPASPGGCRLRRDKVARAIQERRARIRRTLGKRKDTGSRLFLATERRRPHGRPAAVDQSLPPQDKEWFDAFEQVQVGNPPDRFDRGRLVKDRRRLLGVVAEPVRRHQAQHVRFGFALDLAQGLGRIGPIQYGVVGYIKLAYPVHLPAIICHRIQSSFRITASTDDGLCKVHQFIHFLQRFSIC
jgi:hypothetical protein